MSVVSVCLKGRPVHSYYVIQEIERQKEREKLRQIEWENTHRELVGNLPPSPESFAESDVGRVERIASRSHTRDKFSASPTSSSGLIRRDFSARGPVESIDSTSGMDQIHRGPSHGPSDHIESASASSTHQDPSHDSISPMDSISNTRSGQRGPPHVGPRSSAGQIHHHVGPMERTVSADQVQVDTIHSVRDPAESVRPAVADPPSVAAQSAMDSSASASRVEEEPSLLSIVTESGVSPVEEEPSLLSIVTESGVSSDNFRTGSEYSDADQ